MRRNFGLPRRMSDDTIDLRMPVWPFVLFGLVTGTIIAVAMALV